MLEPLLSGSASVLLLWWWVRGIRSGKFKLPYFIVDRQHRPNEFWFWAAAGLLACLTFAALVSIALYRSSAYVLA
jgi:hypothetical protein